MAEFHENETAYTTGQKLVEQKDLNQLPLMSVICDNDGFDSVKVWAIGGSNYHWIDDTGAVYDPVMPVTILSIPSKEAKIAASKGYLLSEDSREHYKNLYEVFVK